MKNQKQTIRKIVGFLNNCDEDGGFWLPNIQRPFVWSEDQICRLFDSILREYPISTLLIWKTTSKIRHRKFIDNWHSDLRLSDFYESENELKKCLVLDGQQRLQSLYIGLKGSYESQELYFDILSGDVRAPEDIKFKFSFLSTAFGVFPYVKFKDLIFTEKKRRELRENIIAVAKRELTQSEKDKLDDNLYIIDKTFKMDEFITYQELDSIDNPTLYKDDDVVEVFIRANSGGTRLSKSDLLFSLLSSSWDFADKKMEELLESLNKHGFNFDRDFVLKSCLVLLNKKARYEVAKFREEGVREAIERNWDLITKSIKDVLDFVRGKTYIQCDRAMPTYLVLIPLVYFRYHFPESWRQAKNIDTYLLRCSLAGAFGGVPDNLIDQLVNKISGAKQFHLEEMFGVIRSQNRSLEVTEEKLWQMGYGSKTIHLLFNLWYRDFEHTPAYENNYPQIDHIFPQSALKEIKVTNPQTGRPCMKYHDYERNQLANCMLLTKEENGAGGKWDKLPEDWFSNKDPEYLRKHLIPEDPSLWKLDRYENFVEARKLLIRQKFKWLLTPLTDDNINA